MGKTASRYQGLARPADDSLIAAYFDLCAQVNRVMTLTPEQLRHSLVQQDRWLYVSSLDQQPVNATLISRHGDDCYYEAGVSLRQGNKPLSHAPLAHAIGQAQDRGLTRFHLGLLHADPAFDGKLLSIAAFKRGFTKTFHPVTWTAIALPA